MAGFTGTSNVIKEQYEKHKKVCWRDFLFSLQKGKIKAMKTEEMRKKVKRNGKGGKRKAEKNLGGEKKKKWKQKTKL